jgi:hypothetical protein
MPQFYLTRLVSSIRNTVSRLDLNLQGLAVLTECATGVYSCTPAIAALAGADEVFAFGKDSPHGTFDEAGNDVFALWNALSLSQDILSISNTSETLNNYLEKADIVTNSGHLRPINAEQVGKLKRGCVIPLMYESWEFRPGDLSLDACQKSGIAVAGTNERHPNIGVFEYLGPLVAKALFEGGLEIMGNNILLISDNDFAWYVEKTLKYLGANVLRNPSKTYADIQAIVFAHTPRASGGSLDLSSWKLPKILPLCCQLWGDVDRSYFDARWIPKQEPRYGHMGLLLSELGIDPIVRLQAGGLKVGQLLANGIREKLPVRDAIEVAVESGYALPIE